MGLARRNASALGVLECGLFRLWQFPMNAVFRGMSDWVGPPES